LLATAVHATSACFLQTLPLCWPLQVFKLVTKPDIDRFVPKRLQHYIPGGELTYTDIIRYDPKLLENPPFKLLVHSIPPIFKNQVSSHTHCCARPLHCFHMPQIVASIIAYAQHGHPAVYIHCRL
jgi:hypothetical protein